MIKIGNFGVGWSIILPEGLTGLEVSKSESLLTSSVIQCNERAKDFGAINFYQLSIVETRRGRCEWRYEVEG